MNTMPRARLLGLGILVPILVLAAAATQVAPTIFDAVLGEAGQSTAEVSTEELRRVLAEKSALVIDARPFREYAVSHIPGAVNVAPKPGVPMSMYVSDVAEIDRLVHQRKDTAIVLYCNGPYCGKSKRLAAELVAGGYSKVRRYQLGIPVWRALGGVTQIEPEGLRSVLTNDHTAVIVEVRDPQERQANMFPNAQPIPRSAVPEGKDVGEIKRAKDDGRLPMEDHNTRLVVIGGPVPARYVAEALAREAFHNVSYFAGSLEEARAALKP